MPTENRTPVLLLSSEASPSLGLGGDSDLLRMTLRVCYLNDAGELRNYLGGSVLDADGEAFADLQINAQCELTSTPYGWTLEYRDVFSVDLRRAETMRKTLRAALRKLERLETELGYAETFAAYCARVAIALGVSTFMAPDGAYRGGMYAENNYRSGDARQLGAWIEQAVRDFKNDRTPAR